MTKSNSSATLSTSNLYEHPWYSQLKLLDNTTTCESPLQPKLKLAVTGLKCTKCDQVKPVNNFRNYRQADLNRQGKFYHCKDCERKSRDVVAQLKKTAPPKPVNCECCNRPTSKFHLDHCTETNTFRGWLCANCNQGIGKLGDSIEGVQAALNYLSNGHQI